MKVAFQGEIGAFSEEAVSALFGRATADPCPTFEDVFTAVEDERVEYGVIPIENSLFGSVHVNYDLLRTHTLSIIGELHLRIRHHLVTLTGASLESIKRVHSHPQALGQCQEFLKNVLPHAEAVPAYDTAGAAKMVAAGNSTDAAAIASEQAATEYNLAILARGIESNHQNYTRFLVLSREAESAVIDRPGDIPYKTSVVYAMRENVPGALFKSLAVFALRDLDLYKIESRPLVGSPGNYLFYLDVGGSRRDEAIQRALEHLEEITAHVKVLGSYQVGTTIE